MTSGQIIVTSHDLTQKVAKEGKSPYFGEIQVGENWPDGLSWFWFGLKFYPTFEALDEDFVDEIMKTGAPVVTSS